MKNSFLKTLATNWRDVLAFVIIGVGLAILGGVIDYTAGRYADNGFARLILPPLTNYLQGFSRFVGAIVSATVFWMMLWPTVNKYGNNNFADGWAGLAPASRFFTYVGLIAVALVAAAICFAA
jgi:hypothetical protein